MPDDVARKFQECGAIIALGVGVRWRAVLLCTWSENSIDAELGQLKDVGWEDGDIWSQS
jgi:hypothetical protein